jgi:sugar/nucleoside kinase (ribokinase family)
MFDLIGIGALNLDCVASKSRILSLAPRIADELSDKVEHNTERPVSEEEVDLTLSRLGASTFETFLGGSAFNTIHTIASVNRGIGLGYIAVAGNTGIGGLDFVAAMNQLGVDTTYVKSVAGHRSGICLSYMADDERSLLTFPGVNTQMSEYLKENYDNILKYLSQAKIVHVTSLFDDESPKTLSDLLRDVKRLSPWVKLSFDPGYHWIKYLTPAVKRILKTSDFLFLNNKEFELLGHYRPGSKEIDVARRILDFCKTDNLIIILKQYDVIKLFYKIQGRMMLLRHANVVIPSRDIEDAAGAGDIFVGGFLTAMLVPGMEIKHGVDLGLRLVRSKLLVAGSKSFHTFPAIFSELIDEITSSRI